MHQPRNGTFHVHCVLPSFAVQWISTLAAKLLCALIGLQHWSKHWCLCSQGCRRQLEACNVGLHSWSRCMELGLHGTLHPASIASLSAGRRPSVGHCKGNSSSSWWLKCIALNLDVASVQWTCCMHQFSLWHLACCGHYPLN